MTREMKRTTTAKWYAKYNRWQLKVQKNGVRKSFYSSVPGRNGKRECHAKADAWLEKGNSAQLRTVKSLYLAWMEEIKLYTSKGYWGKYEGFWRNWMRSRIGNFKMENLTEQHFQDIINAAFQKGLAKKTLSNMRGCFSTFLKYCRKSGATALLLEHIMIPRNAPVKEKKILQPDDLNTLFRRDRTLFKNDEVYEPLVYAFRFQVVTGLRPGELLGLKWRDIDFDKGIVSVKRSINVDREFTTGKNDNAVRNFALNKLSRGTLLENKKRNGGRGEYVFSLDGSWVRPSNYYKRWVKYRNYQGIGQTTPYGLRHTFISVVKTLPEGLIRPLVGHSVNMDTYRVYGHELTGEKHKTADLVQLEFEKHFIDENSVRAHSA